MNMRKALKCLGVILIGLILWNCNGVSMADEEQGVAITSENFPSDVLQKEIRNNWDKDCNKFLSEREIKKILDLKFDMFSEREEPYPELPYPYWDLSYPENGALDLKGIEYLTSLKSLTISRAMLSNINISNLKHLETVQLYCCDQVKLDVRKLKSLKKLSLSSSNIKELKFSHNPALTNLNVYGTQIEELDIRKLKNLRKLFCGTYYMFGNQGDVYGTSIKKIIIRRKNKLEEINVISGNLNDISIVYRK